jgi:GAF domain-containing protein
MPFERDSQAVEWGSVEELSPPILMDSFVDELVEGIRRRIGFQWISIYWVRRDDTLEEIAIREHGFNLIEGVQFENGNGLAAWVAKYQRPVVLRYVHRGHRFRSNPIKSFMCAPIVRDGRSLGVVNLGHLTPNFYSNQSLNQLTEFLQSYFEVEF